MARLRAPTKAATKAAAQVGPRRGRGRPTKYTAEHAELARKFCLLGATNERLAELLEVGVTTIDRWLAQHAEFRGAVKRGREQADARVGESLFERACGYSHAEDKIFLYEGQPVIVPTTKHYAPDPVAAIFWLKNRRPDLWKDRKAVEVSNARDESGELQALLVDYRSIPYDPAQEQRTPPPGKGV